MKTTTDPLLAKMAGLLAELDFDGAAALLSERVGKNDTISFLHTLAEDHSGILAYTFVNYLIYKNGDPVWHKAAGILMAQTMLELPNAEEAAHFHLKQALHADPADWHIKEYLLILYKRGGLPRAEALGYANDILKMEAGHKLALEIREGKV